MALMTKKSAATNVIAVRAHFFADTQSVGAPPSVAARSIARLLTAGRRKGVRRLDRGKHAANERL